MTIQNTALAALALLMLAAPLYAQDESGACRDAVMDALDGLDEVDAELGNAEASVDRAKEFSGYLIRSVEVDELELIDRERDLSQQRISIDRTERTIDEADERGVAGGMFGALGGIALSLLTGGAGVGLFRGAKGRWPFQDPERAGAKHAVTAQRLLGEGEKHKQKRTQEQLLRDLLARGDSGRTDPRNDPGGSGSHSMPNGNQQS